jgi:HSP20 family protein
MSNMSRWDPFQDMLSLREAMNQLIEESVVRSPAQGRSNQGFVPAFDISETQDAYMVEAALPGVKPEDVNVTFENGVLTVSGEARQQSENKERNFHRVERRYGRFQRSVTLPMAVKGDQISASMEHGVLHLVVPKAEEVKPRKITVSVNQGEQANQPVLQHSQN